MSFVSPRRAFLCGSDERTGKNFDHRRTWIEERIHFLAGSFAVSIYSYAVMSNHTHIVLSVDPRAVSGWTDEQAADRWLRVFPGAMAQSSSDEQKQRVRMGLLSTPDRLKEIRERLGSLSWFMRALNEPIARMANGGHLGHPDNQANILARNEAFSYSADKASRSDWAA